jgi:O-methyltransferase involved in polyketide biosynthesis
MDHSKISYTALLCARSLGDNTNIPYAKEIKKELLKQGYNERRFTFFLLNPMARFFKGLSKLFFLLESRYLALNNTLKKLKNPDILELACGITPRGLELMKEDSERIYFETDLSGMLNIKRKIVEGLNVKLSKRHFLESLNILDDRALNKIGDKYKRLNSKKNLAIINTGLWTYLTDDEQSRMADNIRLFLKKYSPNGFWVSPDFRRRVKTKNYFFYYLRKGVTRKTGRPTNQFKDETELISFMNKHGFNVRRVSNKEVVKDCNSMKKFHLSESEALDQFNCDVYVMSLKK